MPEEKVMMPGTVKPKEAKSKEMMHETVMPKTIKLYDLYPYETEFTAQVLLCEQYENKQDKNEHKNDQDCEKGENDKKQIFYKVILDRTLFFPEEGGQSPDKGTINEMEVVDVQITKDVVTHILAVNVSSLIHSQTEKLSGETDKSDSSVSYDLSLYSLQPGDTVSGSIDWQHRFSNMQQHSAEHIFSGIVNKEYQYRNVGFHLSDHIVTMDYDGVLSEEQVEKIEWEVNQAIVQNIEISARYPQPEELAQLEYRSKIEIDGPVRIVSIPGYDVCACCAPHVKRTGEIGMLKVMSVQNYKGGVRISILCGFRALNAFREKNSIVSGLTNMLSTSQDLIAERVLQLKENNQELKLQIGILKQNVMLGKIKTLPNDQKNVILIEEELDAAISRNVVNELVLKHEGVCGVFTGSDETGYRFIVGSKTMNCKEIAFRLRETFGAKGGGSQAMIQGSLQASKEAILAFFDS